MSTLVMLETTGPLGRVQLLARGDALLAAHLCTPDAKHPLPEVSYGTTPVLERAAEQLAAYFAGSRIDFDLPLAAEGTPYQQRVWKLLATIPFGETWTYGQLARAMGDPKASRAVGAANGKNPLWVIVPCHRVIGANGALTGYAGGITAKKWLLAHEQRQQTLV